jgi:hypothetical protein
MAVARWRIRRFVATETVLIDCEIIRNQAAISKEFATNVSDVHAAMAIRSLADESRTLNATAGLTRNRAARVSKRLDLRHVR